MTRSARCPAGGDLRLGRGPFARAVIVTVLLAAALTAILTLSVVPGQVALDVGQVAQTEIRAPRPIHFPSPSQTDAARLAAANAIPPQYEQIAPPGDIASEQLKSLDSLTQSVTGALQQRDQKTLSGDALLAKLNLVAGTRLTTAQIGQVSVMSVQHWKQIAAASRAVVATTQAGSVREDDMNGVRVDAHNAITND